MDASHLELIDSVINASIKEGVIPGAVVGIVKDGDIVYEKAFGNKSLVPEVEPMTLETMFDLASLSKLVSTTTCAMQLIEQGKLRLVDQVRQYIPGFKPWVNPQTRKRVHVTIQDLMTHSSGLDPFLKDVTKFVQTYGPGSYDNLVHQISQEGERSFEPGTDVLYSCFNYIILQKIIETITGERLCDYAQTHVFNALGMSHTTYRPLKLNQLSADGSHRADSIGLTRLDSLCAPTEKLIDGHVLRGEVHDPTARIVNLGNSGNAGVFSNFEDLAVFSAALLNGGSWNGARILSPLTVNRMFTVPADNDPKVGRALGWDAYTMSPYLCGDVFNRETTRGHTGYTGTSILLDLETKTALIILTNRVHPEDKGSIARLRSVIASITASAIMEN